MALKTQSVHETKTLTSSTVSTLSIPVGGKIHNLVLRFATSADANVTVAAIKSEITNIRLTLNGKDLVNASPTKLFDLYNFLGQNVNDLTGVGSVLELNVGRMIYTDPAARDLLGFGTNDVQSIQVSILAGTLVTIANVQAFTTREAKVENLGIYAKFINYVRSYNSTGDDTVDTLPRDPDSSYIAVMMDSGASGVMTRSECRVNNLTLKERCPLAVNQLILSNDRLATPSGYFIHSFTDGNVKTRLPMVDVKDLRFIQTFTTAPGAAGYNASVLTVVNLPTNI